MRVEDLCIICHSKVYVEDCVAITNFSGTLQGDHLYHRDCFFGCAGKEFVPKLDPPRVVDDYPEYQPNWSYERIASGTMIRTGLASWDEVCYDFELSGAVANKQLFYADIKMPHDIDSAHIKHCSFSGSGDRWDKVTHIYKRHNNINNADIIRAYYSGSQTIPTGDIAVSYFKK